MSNSLFADKVREASDARCGLSGDDPEATGALWHKRRWRVVDRLGEKVITELLADHEAGMTNRKLVERYGISLSSVKRLLGHRMRQQGRIVR